MTTTNTLRTGLELFTPRAGAIRCSDCGSWADDGDKIRHSSRCDTPDLQVAPSVAPTTVKDIPRVAGPNSAPDWSRIRKGTPAYEQAMLEVGCASVSEMMNCDF